MECQQMCTNLCTICVTNRTESS